MRTFVALIVLLVATQVARAEKPTARARKLLAAQLDALRTSDDDALWPTFADDAVILGFATDKRAKELKLHEIVFDRIVNGPGEVTKATIASLVAGGDEHTLWWTAVVALSGTLREAGTTTPRWTQNFRISELATKEGSAWKVVAAAFDTGRKDLPEVSEDDAPDKLAGATTAGALTAMLAAPATVAASISSDSSAFVIGTSPGERGIGKAAKTRIAKWSKLALTVIGSPREIRTKTYGFAQATLNWKKGNTTYRMQASIFAVPRPDGSWQPVGLHYQ